MSCDTDLPSENYTPPASGSTTPTTLAAIEASKKSRLFLGLSPLAGFLRSRYPSASGTPSVKSVPEPPEVPHENGMVVESQSRSSGEEDEDEEDRRTIRGVEMASDLDSGQESKAVNGHVNGGHKHEEKIPDEDIPSPPPTTPPSLATHVS